MSGERAPDQAHKSEADARKSDDRFALVTLLVGAAVALVARRDPMLLAAGLMLGMGGVLLAIRGERAIEARSWVGAAFVVAVIAVAARAALDVYQEWLAGLWFAEGAGAGGEAGIRRLSQVTLMLRVLALAAAAGLLLAAATNRLRK